MNEHTRDLILALLAGCLGVVCILLMGCTATQPLDKAYLFEMPETTFIFVPEGSVTHHGERILGKAAYMSDSSAQYRLIIVEAVFKNGKIMPRTCTLGHEVQHQLNWLDDRIICPHDGEWKD